MTGGTKGGTQRARTLKVYVRRCGRTQVVADSCIFTPYYIAQDISVFVVYHQSAKPLAYHDAVGKLCDIAPRSYGSTHS
jgi:hypothetical protein